MTHLPVFAEELLAFEAQLGVRLPEHYTASLLDPKIRAALCSRGIGFLTPGHTMQRFGRLTEEVRQRFPEFPRDGVVIYCGLNPRNGAFELDRGYLRFLVPDKKDPSRLGDTVYSWDPQRRRKSRDCSIKQFIDSPLSCVDGEVLQSLGIPRLNPFPEEPLKVETFEIAQLLKLRGAGASAMLGKMADDWIYFATFRLNGSYLAICDLGHAPGSRSGFRLPPGDYRMVAKLGKSRIGDWPIVRGLRLLSAQADQPVATVRAGTVETDRAAIVVFDRQEFFASVRYLDRDRFLESLAEVTDRPCKVKAGKHTHVAIVPSGDGDGSYPVYTLTASGMLVGIEVRFAEWRADQDNGARTD